MNFNYSLNQINSGTFELELNGVIDARSELPMEHDFADVQHLYIDFAV